MTAQVAVTLTLAGLLTVTSGPVVGDDKNPAAPKSNYERLKILEQSVGSWEGTLTVGSTRVQVVQTVEWMLDKQFLKEEMRSQVSGREFVTVFVRGWDAKAGVMTEHAFASTGDSGSGTSKFGDAAAGKVSFAGSVNWASGKKAGMKAEVEFPDADTMVITVTEQTLNGKEQPNAKVELKRKK